VAWTPKTSPALKKASRENKGRADGCGGTITDGSVRYFRSRTLGDRIPRHLFHAPPQGSALSSTAMRNGGITARALPCGGASKEIVNSIRRAVRLRKYGHAASVIVAIHIHQHDLYFRGSLFQCR